MKHALVCLSALIVLGGCTTLPADGPSSRAVNAGPRAEAVQYAIVDLEYGVTERIKAAAPRFSGSLTGAGGERPIDLIGVGDALAVSIFDPSGGLFGGGGAVDLRGGNQALPALVVDRTGSISIPYAGAVRVEGLTSTQAAEAVRRALRGKVANPQVVVGVAGNAANTVMVLGDVRNPGRAPLSVNADRILDVVGAAGGTARAVEDIVVNIQRNGRTYSAPLSVVTTEFGENVRLQPGDQINLTYKPRRFTVFGAVAAVNELEMGTGPLTLAGALGRARGLDTQAANASQVLVFRWERSEVAQALGLTQAPTSKGVPVIYRLNLAEGQGFFVANSFQIEAEDVIYAPRSNSAELRKFFEFVQSITRVVYDISVTSALNVD